MSFDPVFPTTKGILRKLGGDDNTHTIKWTYRENVDGLVTVGGGAVVKVSGLTPSFEELKGGTVTISGAVNESLTIAEVLDLGGAIVAIDGVMVVYQDGFVWEDEGAVFPEKGIYMANVAGLEYELSYGSILPIDPKFLVGNHINGDVKDENGSTIGSRLVMMAVAGGRMSLPSTLAVPFWEAVEAGYRSIRFDTSLGFEMTFDFTTTASIGGVITTVSGTTIVRVPVGALQNTEEFLLELIVTFITNPERTSTTMIGISTQH